VGRVLAVVVDFSLGRGVYIVFPARETAAAPPCISRVVDFSLLRSRLDYSDYFSRRGIVDRSTVSRRIE
jgi:hypothetical protein